jgi:hypothetical protein
MSFGRKNPDHSFKFALWQKLLQNTPFKAVFRNLPTFRINVLRCRVTLISMHNSKAIEGRNGQIHKDKTIEAKFLRQGRPQESSHGSDAGDSIIEAFLGDVVRFGNEGLPDVSVR